jgi:hypothetical protein
VTECGWFGQLTLADGVLFVAAANGRLYALDIAAPPGNQRIDLKVNGSDGPLTLSCRS